MSHLFGQLGSLPSLHTLVLSQVGLTDASLPAFTRHLDKANNLKKLNISGNTGLTANGLT